jgi:hypothetical protein
MTLDSTYDTTHGVVTNSNGDVQILPISNEYSSTLAIKFFNTYTPSNSDCRTCDRE